MPAAGPAYKGHVETLAPVVKELAELEKRTQSSYLNLHYNKPFTKRWRCSSVPGCNGGWFSYFCTRVDSCIPLCRCCWKCVLSPALHTRCSPWYGILVLNVISFFTLCWCRDSECESMRLYGVVGWFGEKNRKQKQKLPFHVNLSWPLSLKLQLFYLNQCRRHQGFGKYDHNR